MCAIILYMALLSIRESDIYKMPYHYNYDRHLKNGGEYNVQNSVTTTIKMRILASKNHSNHFEFSFLSDRSYINFIFYIFMYAYIYLCVSTWMQTKLTSSYFWQENIACKKAFKT